MKKEETKKNPDTSNMKGEESRFKKLLSDFRIDIFQRYFGAKGGRTLIFAIITVCLGRGLIGKLVFRQPFLYSFFYPIIIIGIVSTIYVIIKIISFKNTKIAYIITKIFLIVCFTFLTLVFLLLIILLFNKILHFWF